MKGSPRAVIGTSKKKTLTFLFPMAKMDGVVIPEHAKSFEAQQSQALSRRNIMVSNHPLVLKGYSALLQCPCKLGMSNLLI